MVEPAELKARVRVIQAIWFSLLGGVMLFGGVAWALLAGILMDGTWAPFLEPGRATLLMVLPVVLVVAGIVVRRAFPAASPGSTVQDRLSAYQTGVIVSGALQEGGGLVGVFLCLVGSLPTHLFGVLALTAFAMVLTRPTQTEVAALLR